jgi:hypothetical protein
MTIVPRSFPIDPIEALNWNYSLRDDDRNNTNKVLQATYRWIDESSCPNNCRDFFTMYAFGSTVEGKKDYGDVDLLLVTNRIWRDLSIVDDLEQLLRPYKLSWNPLPGKAYEAPLGRPNRTVLSIQPQNARRIHLTIQPEIESRRAWESIDRKPRIPIYSVGDERGYRDLTYESLGDIVNFISAIDRERRTIRTTWPIVMPIGQPRSF